MDGAFLVYEFFGRSMHRTLFATKYLGLLFLPYPLLHLFAGLVSEFGS